MLALKCVLTAFCFFVLISVHAVTTHNFPLIDKAVQRQIVLEKEWFDSITKKEITVESRTIKGEKYRQVFKLSGKGIGRKPMKDVFVMLQNWPQIAKNAQQSFIELNKFGGHSFTFRIQKAPCYGTGQIYITNENGSYGIKYDDFFKSSKNFDQTKLAEFMLEAMNTPLNDEKTEEYWTQKYSFLENLKFRNDVKEMMVVAQVAEAARPSDKTFKDWKQAIDEVSEIVIKTQDGVWEDGTKKILKENGIVKDLDPEGYKTLRRLSDQLTIPGENTEAVEQKINTLLGEEVSSMVFDEFKKLLNETNKRGKETFKKAAKNKEVKFTGRVPYADEVFRQALDVSIKNPEYSVESVLDKLFPTKNNTASGRFDILFSNHVSASKGI